MALHRAKKWTRVACKYMISAHTAPDMVEAIITYHVFACIVGLKY